MYLHRLYGSHRASLHPEKNVGRAGSSRRESVWPFLFLMPRPLYVKQSPARAWCSADAQVEDKSSKPELRAKGSHPSFVLTASNRLFAPTEGIVCRAKSVATQSVPRFAITPSSGTAIRPRWSLTMVHSIGFAGPGSTAPPSLQPYWILSGEVTGGSHRRHHSLFGVDIWTIQTSSRRSFIPVPGRVYSRT